MRPLVVQRLSKIKVLISKLSEARLLASDMLLMHFSGKVTMLAHGVEGMSF